MKFHTLIGGLAAVVMLAGGGSDGTGLQNGPTLRIPDGQSLLLSVRAEGVQIYTAKPKAGSASTFEWSLKAPRATLYGPDHKKLGTHGAGPVWELNDGSKVVGLQPPKQRVDAADAKSVAWLLLAAKSHEGAGVLSRVTFIMRVDTSGGIAPAKSPTREGQEAEVKYSATYIFLTVAPTGISQFANMSHRNSGSETYAINAGGSRINDQTNYDAQDDVQAKAPTFRSLTGHKGAVLSVAFARDGKTIASGGADGTIRQWNVASGHEDRSLKLRTLSSAMSAVAFAPDGLTLVSGDKNGNIQRWDAVAGKQEQGPILVKSPNGVKQIVYSPDGLKLYVVTSKHDYSDVVSDRATVRDAKTLSEVKNLMDGYATDRGSWPDCSVSVAPNGSYFVVAFSGFLEGYSFFDLWSTKGEQKAASLGQNFIRDKCLATFSPDGVSIVLAYAFKIFKVELQLVLNHQWWGERFPCQWVAEDTKVTLLAYSPDGRSVVSYSGTRKKESGGRCIRLWDAATGALNMQIPDAGQINALAFSPDSRTLAGACDDGTVKLWDTSSLVATDRSAR